MAEEYCPHIKALDLKKLQIGLTAKKGKLTGCEQCAIAPKPMIINNVKKQEVAEIVYICLSCFHVGCSSSKQAHAKSHYEQNKDHMIITKLNGELYCYKCGKDVQKIKEEDKAKISELQKILKEATSDEEIKGPLVKVKMEEEDKKGAETSSPISGKTEIDLINKKNYEKMIERAKQYSNMKGLGNQGNTCNILIIVRFNRLFQFDASMHAGNSSAGRNLDQRRA